jgi:hypothetical protein
VPATWYVNITVFVATGAVIGESEKLIHYPSGLLERTEALVFFLLLPSPVASALTSVMGTPSWKLPPLHNGWFMPGAAWDIAD